MAFTSAATIGTASSTSAGTSLALVTSAQCPAGNLVILTIALDNTQTTDGQTSEVTSISDPNGNTWTKLGEYCNGQTTAGAGAVISVWRSVLANTIAAGASITATFANSITAKGVSGWQWTLAANKTVQIAGSLQARADDDADPGSLSISGLSSKEYLFFRATAVEFGGVNNFTATTNFTKIDYAYSAGSGSAGMTPIGEFRILTATSSSSDLAVGNYDSASIFFALEEIAAAAASTGNFFPFF